MTFTRKQAEDALHNAGFRFDPSTGTWGNGHIERARLAYTPDWSKVWLQTPTDPKTLRMGPKVQVLP